MEYLVVAYDGTDEGALDRRMNAREAHLEGAKRLKESGNFINGGALLNDDGKMIGSTLYLEFETKEQLDEAIKNDPYTTGGVWQRVETKPIRLVLR
jgi:uncharacterized protein YciI